MADEEDGDEQDPFPRDPLIDAAFDGDLDTIRRLLDAGHDVNGEGPGGGTALHGAIENSRLEAVRLLIERGADVNLAGPNRWTPIAHVVDTACDAAIQLSLPTLDPEDVEILRLLLRNAADPSINCPGSRDRSAVALARKYGYDELAAVLDIATGLLHGLPAQEIVNRIGDIGTDDVAAVQRFINGVPVRSVE